MKVLGVIPARGGSKGIPRKNLVSLGGKPLITWTFDSVKLSKLDRTLVSTDSPEIAQLAKVHGIEVPFLRPQNLSGDSARTIDVVNHVLRIINEEFDAVMVLQPTSPFRTHQDIDACISLLVNSSADSVISVETVGGLHPARMKYLRDGYLIDPPFCEVVENQPRQELTEMFIRNGAIYLTRTEVLKAGSFRGEQCLAHVMPSARSVNIDETIDLQFAEFLLANQ